MQRLGDALWLTLGSLTLLLDCPVGTREALEHRVPQFIVLSSGRLERVCGLLEVLAVHDGIELLAPGSDERGALIGELAQRAWGRSVVIDTLHPGVEIELGESPGGTTLHTLALTDVDGALVLGFHLTWGHTRIGYLPRCRLDGAARHALRHLDLLIPEPGAFQGPALAALAGDVAIWDDPHHQA